MKVRSSTHCKWRDMVNSPPNQAPTLGYRGPFFLTERKPDWCASVPCNCLVTILLGPQFGGLGVGLLYELGYCAAWWALNRGGGFERTQWSWWTKVYNVYLNSATLQEAAAVRETEAKRLVEQIGRQTEELANLKVWAINGVQWAMVLNAFFFVVQVRQFLFKFPGIIFRNKGQEDS